jgi:glycogen debranching enzyme
MTQPHPGDSISVGDHYYILASTFTADLPKLVLKHDDAFFVADRRGDFPAVPDSEFGFYVGDTRFLDRLDLRVHDQRPLLLNAAVSDDNLQLAIDLTNADLHDGDTIQVAGRMLHLARRLTLYGRELSQTLRIENFAAEAVRVRIDWQFGSDFADVFEVRGLRRERRGALLPPVCEGATVRLAYEGLDRVVRATLLAFEPPPKELTATEAVYQLVVPAGGGFELSITVTTTASDEDQGEPLSLPEIVRRRREEQSRRAGQTARIATAHEGLSGWLRRSRGDLHMLVTETAAGPMPYAGIPWYVAPFGRDSLITALQLLPFEPQIARGTLRFLARYQGTHDDPFTEEEPGRILHELRRGEMAACREIPFIPYYGSVDATPLFAMLLAEYLRWTGDRALVGELWPSLERALGWILGPARDESYLRYARRSPVGLGNQGWKDSHDAIMHASGELAEAPIALVEVQGYKYAALLGAAEVTEALGWTEASKLRDVAQRLRSRFDAGGLLQSRPLPVDGHRAREASGGDVGPPDGGGHVLGMGTPDALRARAALQSHELSQRLGLAARHGHCRRRPQALRPERGLPQSGHGALRGSARMGRRAHAGAVLRLRAGARPRAHALPGRLLASGVGSRRALPPLERHARLRAGRAGQPSHLDRAGPPPLARLGGDP